MNVDNFFIIGVKAAKLFEYLMSVFVFDKDAAKPFAQFSRPKQTKISRLESDCCGILSDFFGDFSDDSVPKAFSEIAKSAWLDSWRVTIAIAGPGTLGDCWRILSPIYFIADI